MHTKKGILDGLTSFFFFFCLLFSAGFMHYNNSKHSIQFVPNSATFSTFSVTFLVLCHDVGARLDQEVHTGGSGALDGSHEGRGPVQGRGVYAGASLHEKFDNVHLASVGRMMERCPAELVTHIHISTVMNKCRKISWSGHFSC